MSEKTERRWRINSRAVLEVFYEGHWETAGTRWAYPDNGHNQRFREAVADACGDIDALTSERDEAVRVAGELRAAMETSIERLRMTISSYVGGQAREILLGACDMEIAALKRELDSLTASTGGSSDEPQKEIRE